MANQSPNKPRIPNGTRVQWRARYDFDPLREGIVLAYVAQNDRFPQCSGERAGCKNIFAPVYVVKVDRTPTGKAKATPTIMTPYASRLEAQNPDLLK